jgi:hypothetical protein
MSEDNTLSLPQLREPLFDLRRLAPWYEGRPGSVVAVAVMLALATIEWVRLFSGHGPRPLMFVAILGVAAVLVAGRIRLGVVEAKRTRDRNR